MVTGISHITFIVKDVDRSADLFVRILGAVEVYDSWDDCHSRSREKFLVAGNVWIALMEGNGPALRTYDHAAFLIPMDEMAGCVERIMSLGLDILEDRDRIPGEGGSVYFYDHDNHLIELHAGTLTERLDAYGRK